MGYNVCKLEPKSKSHQFAGFLDGLPTYGNYQELEELPVPILWKSEARKESAYFFLIPLISLQYH